MLGEAIFVADDDRVRRDHHVCLRGGGPPPMPIRAVQDHDAKRRREPSDLSRPVAHERGRADDERWSIEAPFALLDPDVRDRLERLAEAHLVGQHAPDAALAESLQERDPFALVGPERGAKAARNLDGSRRSDARSRPVRGARGIGPRDGCARVAEGVVELDERAGTDLGERAAPTLLALVKLGDDAQEGPQPIDGHRQVMGLGQPQRPRRTAGRRERVEPPVFVEPLEQIEQDRQEIDAGPIEIDAELEPEPPGPLLARRDACVPGRVALDDAKGILRVDFDAPAERTPLRERPRREGAERVLVAVGANDVVADAPLGLGDRLDARELHGPQPLDDAPRSALARAIALDRLEPAPFGPEYPGPVVGGPNARAPIFEGELDERNEHLVEIARQAVGVRDEHLVGVETHTGYEGRIDGSGTVGSGGGQRHNRFFDHTRRQLRKLW